MLRYCEVLRCRLRPCTVFYGLTACILLTSPLLRRFSARSRFLDQRMPCTCTVWCVLKGRCCIVQPTSSAVGMHRRADRYRSIAIVKGYRTVKILWPTDECRKSSRLYKWENSSIFSHFWRNLLVASTTVLYEDLPFNTRHTVHQVQ